MNKIKSVKLDSTNWLEVTIVNELDEIIHCESFGDSNEYQELLNQRCSEFGIEVTTELEEILTEQKAKSYIPTSEEIAENEKLLRINTINSQIFEAKQYLSSTDFYMTVDKYATLIADKQVELHTKRADARELINTLEAELITLQGAI